MLGVVLTSFLTLKLDETFSKVSLDIFGTLTPSLASSRTSLSSKTPVRDLEDRWSLDNFPFVGS